MILQLGKLDVAVLLHERTAPQQLSRDLSEQRIERGWIFFEVKRFLMFEVSSIPKKKKVCFYFISVLSLPSVNFHKLIIALQFFASSVLINQVDLWPVNITGPWTLMKVHWLSPVSSHDVKQKHSCPGVYVTHYSSTFPGLSHSFPSWPFSCCQHLSTW